MRVITNLLRFILQIIRYSLLLFGLVVFASVTYIFFKDYIFQGNEYDTIKASCEQGIALSEYANLSNAMDVCIDETMRLSWLSPWFLIVLEIIGLIVFLLCIASFLFLKRLIPSNNSSRRFVS